MSSIKTISVIGRGGFGALISSLIPDNIEHSSFGSKDTVENISKIGSSDVIFLCIPLDAYPDVLDNLRPHLNPESLVVDVCSVKVTPTELLAKHLPEHTNILFTHPLFGPQSWDSGQQLTLVVTNKSVGRAEEIVTFCDSTLRLRILHMTNEEHDRRMAEIHALTFFIARALGKLNLQSEPFITPSFQKLLDLVALDESHSEALFRTIEDGNPFAAEERQKFLDALITIQTNLQN